MQLNLFEPIPATSSSSPLIGLRVQLPRACSNCGGSIGVVGSSAAMHAARINFAACNAFCRWLAQREADFLVAVSKKFGAPSSPIVIRGGGCG
jgi:hypothetical protein